MSAAGGISVGLAVLALAGAAWAGGSEDGNAGLAALNRGAYNDAARLLTRALNSGELAPADEEFAYYNRAQAYFDMRDYGRAILDLKAALRLKPDDADAQAGLQLAVSKVVDLSDVAPQAEAAGRPSFLGSLGQALAAGAVAGIQQGLRDAAQQDQNDASQQ